MPEDLNQLLRGVAARDQRALRSLIDVASDRLFGVLMRMLRDRNLAEEALQEVFIRVWNKAGLYDHERSEPMGWLIAMARNHAIDTLRRSARQRTDAEEDIDTFADAQPSVEERLHREGRARLVIHCLKLLPPVRATAVKLAYLNGWSYEEISEHLAMPLNTVRTWLRRALLSLRDCAENA